ncbi:MAG: hypothetical protein L0Y72_05255 [Gemmataceae bacterium]|nr:hypothetical protein [Gemmataceae bacterium]
MNQVMEQIRAETAPLAAADDLWRAAIREAGDLDVQRSSGQSADGAQRLARLREALMGEMAAFHERLTVSPYKGNDFPAKPYRKLWQVDIPVTVFPKRDRGFDLVECLVEFGAENKADYLQVVGLFPKERDRVFGKTQLGLDAKLQLDASQALGVLPAALAGAGGLTTVEEAGLKFKVSTKFDVEHTHFRNCAMVEIVRGIGGRWRLDDPHNQRTVRAESHQFQAILETADGIGPVHAAGYIQAQSSLRWVTATLGSIWESLKDKVKALFGRGIPVEAYGEWTDILKSPV